MTNPPQPPPPDLTTPQPPPPDLTTPQPPSLDSNSTDPLTPPDPSTGQQQGPASPDSNSTDPPTPPDPGTGQQQDPASPATTTYKFAVRKDYDIAMSEIDELRNAVRAAREFATFVMTKDRTWPETEAELRLVHEECHWHLEHDHGIII